MTALRRSQPGWVIALVAVSAATVVRLALAVTFGPVIPYAPYFLAMLLVALVGSTSAVVWTSVLSAVVAAAPTAELVLGIEVPDTPQWPWHLRIAVVGIVLALLSHRLQRAQREADAALVGAEAHGQAARQERTRLQQIVSSVPGVVWEAWGQPDAREQRIGFVSDHVREMLGYTPEEWTTTPNFWLQIVAPEDRDAAARVAAESYASGLSGENVFRWLTKDGRRIWVMSRSAVIKDERGQPIGMRGVTLDITDRKQAEERLALLAELSTTGLTATFDELAVQIARGTANVLGEYCIVRTMRDGHLDAVAYAHIDPAGEAVLERIARADVSAIGPLYATLMSEQRTIIENDVDERAFAHVDRAGLGADFDRYRARRRIVVPLVSRSRVLGTLAVGRASESAYTVADAQLVEAIASRAALALDNAQLFAAAQGDAEEARRARAEAEEAGRVKDEFLATLSHELRTPLNAIMGWAHMLKEERLAPERRQSAIDTIVRNAHSQEQLIADILDVQRIMAGKVRLTLAPVDLGAIIRAAAETVRPTAELKQMRLELALDPLPPMMGDADRLKQVIWNLLSNAIKFAPAEGVVQATLTRQGTQALIVVRDNGPGIAPGFLPYIFERFRQADSSTTRTHKGLGLGLAIVRSLVELHGGTITGANTTEPNQTGAVFTILLPCETPHGERPPRIVERPRPFDDLAQLDGLSVLVVDDDADARELMAVVLNRCGAAVTLAASAAAAVDAFARTLPDVVVSDIEMPLEDGYSLIKRLGEIQGDGRPVPAIAVTAYASTTDRARVLAAGFNVHLSKPIQPAALAATIARLTGRDRRQGDRRR